MKMIRILFLVLSILSIVSGCALKGEPVHINVNIEKSSIPSGCVEQFIFFHSLNGRVIPSGSGKPYNVKFYSADRIDDRCQHLPAEFSLSWLSLVLDEIPDIDESKLRLSGKWELIESSKLLRCDSGGWVLAYSDWYPVEAFSFFGFREPLNPNSPENAVIEAFFSFVAKTANSVEKNCQFLGHP